MALNEYHSHNESVKCHDLCTKKLPSTNMATLLGLGVKLWLQSKTIDMKKFKEMITRFKYGIRVKYYDISNHGHSDKPPPELCFKSTSTNVLRAPSIIEGTLNYFEKALRIAVKSRKIFNRTNITKLQENILKYFQAYPEWIILQADKNLGPCVMNR